MKSFILHFKYPAFIAAVLFFFFLEVVIRMSPVKYFTGAGVFLTETRRELAEAQVPEFDYIILGASKSLSIEGHRPSAEEPFSIYNFSMPAMGSRYFKFFMEKYLKNRKHVPSAVIFAGDPGLFQDGWNRPFHDPNFNYSESPEDTLAGYLYRRLVYRVQYALRQKEFKKNDSSNKDMVWDVFSHRYLHFFSIREIAEQMTGAERIFIIKEAVPNLYYTYRYKDALHYILFGIQPSHFKKRVVPSVCGTCKGLYEVQCYEGLPKYQRSLSIEAQLDKSYGQINLGDLLDPQKRTLYQMLKNDQIKIQTESFNSIDSNLKYLEELAVYLRGKGIKLIVSNVPSIDAYRDTRFHRHYTKSLFELEKKYDNVKVIAFPNPYYPREDFVEQVHFECEGAKKLNRDFYSSVVPRILEFAPYDKAERVRGFDDEK